MPGGGGPRLEALLFLGRPPCELGEADVDLQSCAHEWSGQGSQDGCTVDHAVGSESPTLPPPDALQVSQGVHIEAWPLWEDLSRRSGAGESWWSPAGFASKRCHLQTPPPLEGERYALGVGIPELTQ